MIVNIDDNPDIVAVIVTLGVNVPRLMSCIESLCNQHSQLKLAILCIVNSPEFNRNTLDLTAVTVVVTGLNLGFAGGLSFSRQFIDAAYLWIIQDDMLVEKNCLNQLFLKLDTNAEMAATGPVVVSSQGEVIPGTCGGILDESGKILRWLPATPTLPINLADLNLLSYIPSRGMLIKTTAWDAVQGVDARYYPVLWTDVDLCTAFKKHGLKFMIVTSAIASHEINGSTPSMLSQFVFHRNNALFITKWFTHTLEKHEELLNDSLRPCSVTSLHGQVNAAIDRGLLNTIAQSAADAFLHLSHEYTVKMKFAREEILQYQQTEQKLLHDIQTVTAKYEQIKQELFCTQNSISWRLTQPLRKLKAMFLKLRV